MLPCACYVAGAAELLGEDGWDGRTVYARLTAPAVRGRQRRASAVLLGDRMSLYKPYGKRIMTALTISKLGFAPSGRTLPPR